MPVQKPQQQQKAESKPPQQRHRLSQNLLKVLLSVFIVFQISTIIICPNPDGILFRRFSDSIVAYGNFFGLNTTWRFFSPNPAVRILEYDVFKKDATGELKSESFRYPKKINEEKFRDIYGRKLNNEMYVVAREMLPETLGARLCREHAGAETIAIYVKGRVFPTIEKSRVMGQTVGEIGELSRNYLMDVTCEPHEKL